MQPALIILWKCTIKMIILFLSGAFAGCTVRHMNKDIIIGSALIFLSLGCIFYITYWSRKTINFIHKKKLKSAREILTKLDERR